MLKKLLPLLPWGPLLLATGCSPGQGPAPGMLETPLAGKDGPLTVREAHVIVNRYAQLALDAATGDRRITLRSAAPLGTLERGDLLLIIQMQGASIDTSDSARFGEVTALNNAGRYELVVVEGVEGDAVVLGGGCRLRNSYSASGAVQLIRVPQYSALRIEPAGSITAPAWNGAVGGVVALHVRESVQLDGLIDVSGRGFRGGQVDNLSANNDGQNVIWRSNDPQRGGEKGEGIAGSPATYVTLGGRYGRGAPANGGGGGNSHNAAGGGGANGNNGKPWTGQGVMDGTVTGAAAWTLDPGYLANGNRLTDSSGGGRGGYSFSQSVSPGNPDPLRLGPGSPQWGGDWRREVGGLGGRPVPNDPALRLFLGGGGGAGDGNDMAAGAGGNGGGLVLLVAGTVGGSGLIRANGLDAPNNGAQQNDGGGGGGAGGTVVVAARSLGGIRIEANGGKGGNQLQSEKLDTAREAEGPGGGGGGGFIAVSSGNLLTSARGGAGGTSASRFVASFPSNGATRGAEGQALEVVIPASLPICMGNLMDPPDLGGLRGSDVWVELRVSPDPTLPDQPVAYTISVGNRGPEPAPQVRVSFTLPPSGTVESIEAGPGWQCHQAGPVITCNRSVVEPGQAPDILIRVRYPATDTEPVTAHGTVSSANPDPRPADNQVSVTTRRGGLSLAGGGLTCNLGGGRGGGAPLLLLGALLGAARRRRRAR